MANMTFKANLLPNTDLGYSLGSENQRWNIYGKFAHTPNNTTTFLRGDNTFSNTLTGNIYTKGYYMEQANANSTQTNHAAMYIWGDVAAFTYRDSSNAYLGDAFYYNITNGDITAKHEVYITNGNLSVGTSGETTDQRRITLNSGSGDLILFSNASATGNRGLWVSAHGTGAGKNIITIDTNNNATFTGNADTASKWQTARTLTIGSTGKSVDGSANVSWSHTEIGATVSNTWTAGTTAGPTIKTTVNGVTSTAVAIPSASETASGIITTGNQTLAGLKTFKNDNGAIMTSKIGVTRGTIPSTNLYSGLYLLDSTGQHAHSGGGRMAIVEAHYATDGKTGLTLATYPNTVGSTATNYIGIFSTQSGTASYTVKDPAAFRTAISAAASSHTHNYLPLTGGTLTGDLYIRKAGTPTMSIKVTDCDMTKSNNNITQVHYPTSWNILDNGDRIITRQEAVLVANTGEIMSYWYIRNYNTDGSTQFQDGITLYGPKGGSNRRAQCSIPFYGAVWNDYAEYRETKEKIEPGRCVVETGKGDLILSTKRLQEGCEIVSDTFGFAIGQSKICNTPTAASGRVLAYLYENKKLARPGQPICSGPNGTISLMTNEEAKEYPWCIIGTVSEIPNYEIWEAGNPEYPTKIQVNGRIWIRIR